jgi:two-component system response regulator QseB
VIPFAPVGRDPPGAGSIVRVLLVEDDPMIGKALVQGLGRAGFAVDWAADGRAAELAMADGVYDAVVLDLGLPRKDGFDVLREARARGNDVPVLVATARDALAERVSGLDAGADDYLTKPFDLEELVARLRALIRRGAGRAAPRLECGALVLDPVQHSVRLRGRPVPVSGREFAILEALMRVPGAVRSPEALEQAVYGWHDEVGSNAIQVHLHNLRKKLGAETIKTVRGVGYRVVDVQ